MAPFQANAAAAAAASEAFRCPPLTAPDTALPLTSLDVMKGCTPKPPRIVGLVVNALGQVLAKLEEALEGLHGIQGLGLVPLWLLIKLGIAWAPVQHIVNELNHSPGGQQGPPEGPQYDEECVGSNQEGCQPHQTLGCLFIKPKQWSPRWCQACWCHHRGNSRNRVHLVGDESMN